MEGESISPRSAAFTHWSEPHRAAGQVRTVSPGVLLGFGRVDFVDGRLMAGKNIRSGMLAGCVAAATVAALNGGSARATVLFSTGFEATTTNDGSGNPYTSFGYKSNTNLQNQPTSGVKFDSILASGNDIDANNPNTSTPQAAVASYASSPGFQSTPNNQQYLQLNDGGISPAAVGLYFPTLSTITPVTAGTPFIDVALNLAVVGGATGNPGFGVVVLDDSDNDVADFSVNAGTDTVTLNSGAVTTSFTPALQFNSFDAYDLRLNYAAQTVSLLEGPVGSTPTTP